MKFRSDFVTNSSSSSFSVYLSAALSDGSEAWFRAYDEYNWGVCDLVGLCLKDETGSITRFIRDELYPENYSASGDDDDDECSDCEEEEKLVSVNLAELLPAYEGGATVFSPEKVGNRLVEFAGIADNQYEEGAKKSLMAFAERMRDENVRYTELSLEAVFGGSDGMYWGFNEIIERIFLPEQASQLIAVLNIEDHALREELIFELDCLKDFTWTSVMDLMYMWDHFDDEQACYMRQTLRSDEYIDMVFTWGCDMRRGRDLDYKGKTT